MYIVQTVETLHKGTQTYVESCSVVVNGVNGSTLICNSSCVGQYVGNSYKFLPTLRISPTDFKQMLKIHKSRGAVIKYDSRR